MLQGFNGFPSNKTRSYQLWGRPLVGGPECSRNQAGCRGGLRPGHSAPPRRTPMAPSARPPDPKTDKHFSATGQWRRLRDTKSHRCYLLQELVVKSVGAVKLEHHVSGKGVFNAADNVFCFSLRQLHRLGRLKEWTQTLELWDGCQLL